MHKNKSMNTVFFITVKNKDQVKYSNEEKNISILFFLTTYHTHFALRCVRFCYLNLFFLQQNDILRNNISLFLLHVHIVVFNKLHIVYVNVNMFHKTINILIDLTCNLNFFVVHFSCKVVLFHERVIHRWTFQQININMY